MSVALTITIDGYDYGFDFEDKRIDIDATITDLDVSDLWTAIKKAQEHELGIIYPLIADAEGLTTLENSIKTYLTVSLRSTWEINTLKTSGKFTVKGGNLVRADEEDPFRDNPLITYINNLSQAGVVAETGVSGLTPEESTLLSEMATKVAQLTFSVANVLDANIKRVNDTEVIGSGTELDPWGP